MVDSSEGGPSLLRLREEDGVVEGLSAAGEGGRPRVLGLPRGFFAGVASFCCCLLDDGGDCCCDLLSAALVLGDSLRSSDGMLLLEALEEGVLGLLAGFLAWPGVGRLEEAGVACGCTGDGCGEKTKAIRDQMLPREALRSMNSTLVCQSSNQGPIRAPPIMPH